MKPDLPNKILLVDDTLSIIDFMKDLLLTHGYQVYIATSGEKALQIAENITPDLILLDILMPGLDGYETCENLKKNAFLSNIPVIIMSALSEPFDKVKAFSVGASDYISKPIETEELFARIDTHLRLYTIQKQLLETNVRLEERVKERTSELQKAKEKAEESDRLKSAFLANISHEIRTPLNGILGFSELVAIPELPHEKRVEYVRTISDCGEKLLKTVNDILDLSKLQAHIHKIHQSNVNIIELLCEIMEEFLPIAQLKGLQFLSDIDQINEKIFFHTDRDKLKQILSILIENAIKFTENGSIVLGCFNNEHEIEFIVSDTGVGIPGELLDKMFENFRQGQEGFSRDYGGTGVGLAICKGLVELLGGTIKVNSKLGTGTTFNISFKKKEDENKEQVLPDYKHLNMQADKKFTILVAEDEIANFMFINEIFCYLEKVEIIHAMNGILALEQARENKNLDLVLMDIKMPEMDGVEAMIEIKKIRPELPIIALTAYASEEDRMRFLSSGFDNYFSKPVKASELLAFVNTYLQ